MDFIYVLYMCASGSGPPRPIAAPHDMASHRETPPANGTRDSRTSNSITKRQLHGELEKRGGGRGQASGVLRHSIINFSIKICATWPALPLLFLTFNGETAAPWTSLISQDITEQGNPMTYLKVGLPARAPGRRSCLLRVTVSAEKVNRIARRCGNRTRDCTPSQPSHAHWRQSVGKELNLQNS